MTPAIELKSLQFAYPGRQPVIDIPDLAIAAGERVFLYGPSGSGKTTLLGLLAGILTASRGTMSVLGRDLTAMRPSDRDRFRGLHIGYVFQMFNLLPYLNVLDNILLPLKLNPVRGKEIRGEFHDEAVRLAAMLGIRNLLEQNVTSLSVGQQQRVATARAMIGNPEILICDEPTSALDEQHRDRFLNLMLNMTTDHNTTVLFVSHDRNLASHFDRKISLREINRAEFDATQD